MSFILGLDIGASYIKTGIVDEKGRVKNYKRYENRAKSGENFFINQLADIVNEYRQECNFKKIGIGFAGQVNYKKGTIISDINMGGVRDLSLKSILEKKLKKTEIKIDNDAHCFALAESRNGAGINYRNMLGLTLGTGIGGGIVIDGKLYRGAKNMAGEVGHMVINAGSDSRCGCGGYGHWEDAAGGKGLQKIYRGITEQEVEIDLIIDMAARGEKIAQKAMIEIGYNFAVGLGNLISIFNPEIVIIGGGLTNVDLLWQTILNNVGRFTLDGLKDTKIARAKLGKEAGIIGATLLFC